ncbi:MAG TPA: nucleoside 2-deoxyribosyltransferase [Xanthobacteraceae bacterium]|nr:nucleoside 2-deoxyribosyltransferase [Xanthobacteraceae bacterium]
MKPKVYLAGPGVFRRDAIEHGKHLKELCEKHGLIGLYPLDNEINLSRPDAAQRIYLANLDQIRQADAVIADISPFRGPHMDPGTAFEIGYARAKSIPTFLYSDSDGALADRITPVHLMATGEWFDKDGMLIENFGLAENLMITPSQAPTHRVHATAEVAIKAAAEEFGKAS